MAAMNVDRCLAKAYIDKAIDMARRDTFYLMRADLVSMASDYPMVVKDSRTALRTCHYRLTDDRIINAWYNIALYSSIMGRQQKAMREYYKLSRALIRQRMGPLPGHGGAFVKREKLTPEDIDRTLHYHDDNIQVEKDRLTACRAFVRRKDLPLTTDKDYLNLAKACLYTHRYHMAERTYAEAKRKYPDAQMVYFMSMQFYLYTGRHKRALEDVRYLRDTLHVQWSVYLRDCGMGR